MLVVERLLQSLRARDVNFTYTEYEDLTDSGALRLRPKLSQKTSAADSELCCEVDAEDCVPGGIRLSLTLTFPFRLDSWLLANRSLRYLVRAFNRKLVPGSYCLYSQDRSSLDVSVWRHRWTEGLTVQTTLSPAQAGTAVGLERVQALIGCALYLRDRLQTRGRRLVATLNWLRRVDRLLIASLWASNIPGVLVLFGLLPAELSGLLLLSLLAATGLLLGVRVGAIYLTYGLLLRDWEKAVRKERYL